LEKLVTSDAEESPIFPSVRIAFSDNAKQQQTNKEYS
jgi:hypothetical protein